jgi:hypothetical protein
MMQARRYNNLVRFCSLILILFLMIVSCQAKKISRIRDTAIQKQNASEYYYNKKDCVKAKELCEETITLWNQVQKTKIKPTPEWAINKNISRCENIIEKCSDYITSFEKYKAGSKFIPFKAFAVDLRSGGSGKAWGYTKPKWAIDRALQECHKRNENCKVYAIGNTIVSDMSSEQVAAVSEKYYASVAEAAGPRRGTIRLAPTQEALGAGLASKQLSSDEIRPYLAGSTFEKTTINGLGVVVQWSADGTMSGQGSNSDAEINVTDNGTWWVEDNKLCWQWERFQGGEVYCAVIVTDGKTFILYYSDGDVVVKYDVVD